MASRCLVLVHAHPDDEALGTGGTIARYADEGARVCLITCTNGELGEVADVPELGSTENIRRRLGEVRRDELVEACARLGNVDLRMLGFHDSGMAGTPENDDPKVFANQDLDEPVRKIVAILREVRPQVVITYNEFGFYGHPDHIRAHEAALAAVEAARDPAYAPEDGDVHEVEKVYYTAIPKGLLRAGREMAQELGWADADEFFSDEEVERIATEDDRITTAIDVSRFLGQKFGALEAHRTQLGTTSGFLQIPQEFRLLAFGTEHYVLARGPSPANGLESDLFEGIAITGAEDAGT